MLRTLAGLWPADSALPARAQRLLLYRRVLDGTLYDALPYEFHEERTAGGEYIPLRMRRPSVRYALARVVVEDAVALLFGEGMFPRLTSADAAVQAALARLAGEMRLGPVMTEAALRGSVGSVALHLRVLGHRPSPRLPGGTVVERIPTRRAFPGAWATRPHGGPGNGPVPDLRGGRGPARSAGAARFSGAGRGAR